MKPKKLRIVVLLFVALMVGWVIWQFSHTPEYVATANIRVYSTTTTDAPKAATPVAPVAQVELPKAAAVGASGGTDDSKAVSASVLLAQAEVHATVLDMAKIRREKGFNAYVQAYYRPDFVAKQAQLIQRMVDADSSYDHDPGTIQSRDLSAQKFDHLATLTPTINETGDKAYYLSNAGDPNAYFNGTASVLMILQKIDGKWYDEPDKSK